MAATSDYTQNYSFPVHTASDCVVVALQSQFSCAWIALDLSSFEYLAALDSLNLSIETAYQNSTVLEVI